ncbi:Ca2+ regulator and membrane fusion protein Fig1-domain-containing protein [Lasiosphaeris hirsuta]|uniref:Ca2+ regulator and membrane fusion protein Fig1-domain-containing protein n=1 Tax=Lasiosphaeris hirsuta TaxID=260670 RepID=A0AA40A9Y3_9PEZI|nr:Ca2+ regulator and membrane fusion protein Fig1-domain-containing protein [Lasiosphaeris hirsuta]
MSMLRGAVTYVGTHRVLMIITIVSTILVSVLLAGCSSPRNMSSIYVLALSYQKAGQTVLRGTLATEISTSISKALESSTGIEVRAGCFSLCVRRDHGGEWECSRDAQALQTRFLDSDPLSLVSLASAVRDDIMIVLPGFLITQIGLHSIACIALIAFPNWYDEATKGYLFPSRSFARAAQFASGAAALFGLISALWQHTAAIAVRSIMSTAGYGHVISRVGTAAVTLAWASYVMLMLVFVVILRLRSFVQTLEDADETEGSESLRD